MANALPRVDLSAHGRPDTRIRRTALAAWLLVWLGSVAGLIALVAIGPN